jgi:[acyl-carrier-protein] S-malonyltransferase
MHTSITWQRSIPNRAAVLLGTTAGGFEVPPLPLLSGVTGKASYNDHNSRELLHRWTDHPQRLWDMVHETLASRAEAVVHVGPAPNIIPATFKRISDDVRGQLVGYSPSRLGLKAVSHMVRRPWLSQLLPNSTALLRAPVLKHIILEDWLLEQNV